MNYRNKNKIQQVEESNFDKTKIFGRNSIKNMQQTKKSRQDNESRLDNQSRLENKSRLDNKSKQLKDKVQDEDSCHIQQKLSERPFMLQSKSRHLTQQSQTQQCSYPLYYQQSSSSSKHGNYEPQPTILKKPKSQQNKIQQAKVSCGDVFSFILFVVVALLFVAVFSFMLLVNFGGLQYFTRQNLANSFFKKIGLKDWVYSRVKQYYDYQDQYLLTDTQGTQCNKLGSSSNYNTGKLYPYLYLDVTGQNMTKYCASMCPSGNPQFDRQTVQIYSGSFIALRHQTLPPSIFGFTSSQSPSKIFPGLCLSQQKLSLIQKADPLLYIEFMQRKGVVKAFTYGFWIVVVFAVVTLVVDLLLKTNLLSTNSNRVNSYLRFDFVVIISTGLILIILTCILLGFDIYRRYHIIYSVNTSFSALSQHQLYLSIALFIMSTFILQYFLYNIFFRYNKVIDTAILLLKEAEQNIHKIRFILYSIFGMFIMLIVIVGMGFACFYANKITSHYQSNDLIKTITFGLLIIMSLYCYNFIKQLFLYVVTYESLLSMTKFDNINKSSMNKSNQNIKSITFISFKNFCHISKCAIINTILLIPIKLVQIINLNYTTQEQERNCLISIINQLYQLCFSIFGCLINKVHQISLNNYSINMMIHKFELIRPISNKLTNYQLNCLHHLYSFSYTRKTQRSSFYLYCLSQWIIKLFIVFTLHYLLQDPNFEVNNYRSFSIALITSWVVCIISAFSKDYIFTNAQIFQLRHILNEIQTNRIFNQQHFNQQIE